MNEANMNRREFLSVAVTLTGGLIISYYIPPMVGKAFASEMPRPDEVSKPNAFIQIAPDGRITMVSNKLEMGQGVHTSLAQLLAEELECDWKQVHTIAAPVNPVYNHVGFPFQLTGGSSAVRSSWQQHRMIGASMREMLKAAAAKKWGVAITDVYAENGKIVNRKTKSFLSYGDLAEEASKMPLPSEPKLKSPKEYKIIGKSVHRVDAAEKSNGKAIFGIDVRLPGMLYVMVARPTIKKASLKSYNEKAALKVKDVVKVIKFDNKVAVVAKNTHAARLGRDALKATWNAGEETKKSSASIMEDFKKRSQEKGLIAENHGSIEQAANKITQTLSLEYEFPYLAHATLEPMNCTINYDGKSAELWAGFQMPTGDHGAAVKALGLPPDKVKITTVYAGGSFGRRANKNSDYTVEACEIAKRIKKPIKVMWTREDDMRAGYFRPMNFHKVQIGLDKNKNIVTWDHHVVGHTVVGDSPMEAMIVKNGLEATVTEGVSESPYKFENFRVQQTIVKSPMTTLWWRSVGHTHTAYAMETALDEVAEKTGKDPFELRKLHLKDPRHLAVVDLLQKKAKTHLSKLSEGRAWGLAVHESFKSVVGHLVEVSVQNGSPKVHRVWSAVHCGQVVNPEGAKTQVEGAIVFGLSSLHQQITLQNADIIERNYDTYPVLRIQDMPEVHVEFVASTEPPTGLGEPGVPPILPAVTNALYKITKKRIYTLPFRKEMHV